MNSTTLQFTGKCVLPLYKYSVVSVYISTYLHLHCFDKKNETNKNIFRFCLGASLTLSFSSYFHIYTRTRYQKLLSENHTRCPKDKISGGFFDHLSEDLANLWHFREALKKWEPELHYYLFSPFLRKVRETFFTVRKILYPKDNHFMLFSILLTFTSKMEKVHIVYYTYESYFYFFFRLLRLSTFILPMYRETERNFTLRDYFQTNLWWSDNTKHLIHFKGKK